MPVDFNRLGNSYRYKPGGMKDFRLFDISDFVMDEDFIRWVHNDRKDANDFWNNWLAENPHKHMVLAEARRIVESIGKEQRRVSTFEINTEVERLLSTIRDQPVQTIESPVVRIEKTFKRKWWYAAAAFVLVASTLVLYFSNLAPKAQPQFAYSVITGSKKLVENINTSEKAIKLQLPDGSTVQLGANSRISYANNFDSAVTRDVYLSGEAFFIVAKNPARPFRVFANEVVTKVLGTSFAVRSFEKDTVIQVLVKTGKVSVYTQVNADAKEMALPNQLGGIILTPNQKLLYQKSKEKFEKVLLENPTRIQPVSIEEKMLYEDAPLATVFAQLSDYYGIGIVYDNEVMKNCTVTADLRNEPFYRKVELICKAVGASYGVMDGQVVIQANGCD
jgi:transmembrane sensor